MTATVDLEKATAAFLKYANGYFVHGIRLMRIIRPPTDSNAKTVLVEDCWTLKAEEMDRGDVLGSSVALWPPELR